jgi:5-formyltetrahydrofolate cyclo-ligase
MDMLSLSSLEDYRSLQPDSWGIPTIPKESVSSRGDALKEEGGLDLIVMPGVAFDESFKRCGHGKGYYDYYLTRYRQSRANGRMPVLVALALKEQMLGKDEVPTDQSDWFVDIIVTGDGRCLRRSREEGVLHS